MLLFAFELHSLKRFGSSIAMKLFIYVCIPGTVLVCCLNRSGFVLLRRRLASGSLPNTLQAGTMTVMTNAACQNVWGNSIIASHICVTSATVSSCNVRLPHPTHPQWLKWKGMDPGTLQNPRPPRITTEWRGGCKSEIFNTSIH